MSLSKFISQRLSNKEHSKFTRFIIQLSTVATAMSVAVMILSVAIIVGFKDTIKDKLFVFWDHAQITQNSPSAQNIIPDSPFLINKKLLEFLHEDTRVKDVFPYLIKPVILQTPEAMEGVQLKGVETDFLLAKDLNFSHHEINDFKGNQIILSTKQANALALNIGDSLLINFMGPNDETPRLRKVGLSNIFHTGISEVDDRFALAPLHYLQDLDEYNHEAIHAYQIAFKSNNNIEQNAEEIYQAYIEPPLVSYPLSYVFPNIFGWLELLNKNTYIIIIIMAIVAIINLSTALLIFMVDRTPMVGLLKSQGAKFYDIQKIFIRQGIRIAFKGILWGCFVGIGLALLQQQFKIIKLDEAGYYMSHVPIKLIWWHVLLIIIGSITAIGSALYFPSLFAKRIKVLKALKL